MKSVFFGRLRRVLDALYLIGGALGAVSMVGILLVIVAQMVARWLSISFPGSTSYAGYLMAASTFFALAYALNHGAHIRVTLVLSRLGRFRRWGEIWCHGIAAGIVSFFAFHAVTRNLLTHKFYFISQGQDATPLWIPELAMSVGGILLAIALWDHLIRLIFTGHPGVPEPDLAARAE